ncbi:MAG: hypothetical protein V3W41_07135 [Planctomycetota bacterium]
MNEAKKPDPRSGSARAKLEAFERKDKGNRLLWKKLLIMAAILAAVLVAKVAFDHFTNVDTKWFEHPKNIAWMMREGKWEDIEPLLAEDLKVIGGPAEVTDAKSLISFLQQRGDRLPVFATHPHRFGESAKGHWVSFFATWARGNLEKSNTVPLVDTWLVNAEIVERDGTWVVVKVELRPTINVGSGSPVELPR